MFRRKNINNKFSQKNKTVRNFRTKNIFILSFFKYFLMQDIKENSDTVNRKSCDIDIVSTEVINSIITHLKSSLRM